MKEFADQGFAGARVDAIARRAAINKRMLYHYFGDKEGLFRAVLRRKIAERQAWAENLSGDPAESLPSWFKLSCKDADWIRLLEWEALQSADQRLIDGESRRKLAVRSINRIRQQQARGHVSREFDPRLVLLAMRSLAIFPLAFPQLTKLIVGRPVFEPRFQKEYAKFLEQFSGAFQTAAGRRLKTIPSD